MHRAVYGGKTSGSDFRNHLRSCIEFINFTSCPADPDVWMRPAIKSDGTKCYDYVLLYVDDALVVSKNAESILRNELGRYFELKEESIGPPDHYLGGKSGRSNLKMVYIHGNSVHPNMFKQLSRIWRHTLIHKTTSAGRCQVRLIHP